MQGKNIVKFFLVILIIVCAVQYFFIYPTTVEERKADQYAMTVAEQYEGPSDIEFVKREARTAYLDSISSEVIFRIPLIKDYTYEDLKRQQLALGLDLKGGMSVVLQVDLREFLQTLSENSRNADFNAAMEAATERQRTSSTDFITLFGEEYNKLENAAPLANIFIRNATLKEDINYESSNADVIRVLRRLANETVDLTYKRLKDRIDKFGVTQPNVSLDENRDIIIVELPGVDNPERARRFLSASAKLEFWDVYRISDQGIANAFAEADRLLERMIEGDTSDIDEPRVRLDSSYTYVTDSLGNPIDSVLEVTEVPIEMDPFSAGGPLLSQLTLNSPSEMGMLAPLSVMGFAEKNKKRIISEYLEKPEIRRLFPNDLHFRWAAKPSKNPETGEYENRYELYAVKSRRGGAGAGLEGDRITNASAQPDPMSNQITVSLSMDNAGARIWNDMTTRASQDNNREIAIILDDEVVSAPRVNQPIPSGNSQITGDFTMQEAKDLANILQVGKLPAKTTIIQESLVGPSLGAENIRRSINSLAIGFGLLLGFMILYYSTGGIISIIALLSNLFFIFGVLASYGTVLTLPGIAGIVLTIGMAVDANVIIFERIKEELAEGKSLLASIADGFQNSYSAIIDANVTTLLTAIVLAYFGLGPIKGFAVVLIIGILCTLFTAVLVTRLAIDYWTVTKGKKLAFTTGFSEKILNNVNIDWLSKRKTYYSVSAAIILAGIVSFAVRGFEFGVDFKGGYSYNITFVDDNEINAQDLREQLATTFEMEPVVKAVDTRNTFNVVTSYLINETSDDAEERVMAKLFEGVNAVAGGNLDYDAFKDPSSSSTHVNSFSKVGPTIAEDIKSSSLYAAVFALLFIFVYILVRFSRWQYSVGSMAALLHDTLIVLAVFSIFHGVLPFSMEIDQAFIAAILTVIGYSMNDTVIVFDRIREFLNTYATKDSKSVVNLALNKTLNRTVITSFTTLLVVAILFVFGGSSIKGFAFALLIGVIVGTYSSIFVATPIMYDLSGDLDARTPEGAKAAKAKASV